ncbi:hypothetical protein [Nonlabens sp. Asnod3-A02]|uniref:hypothetical protein n=1 Tax=Nonlabens sp. Asnod3-A02 TaxID=3160579 RepID=UPI0038668C7C
MKKTIIAAVFAAASVLTACKESEKEKMADISDDVMNEVENSTEDMMNNTENAMDKTVSYTEEQATQMANDFESNVEVKDGKIVSIKGYDAYNNLRTSFTDLKESSADNVKMKSESLRASFNSFKTSIPEYLHVDDVNDAIEDVEKEIKEYEEEMVGKKASEKNNKKNIEKIQEAFDDLEKEMVQAREKFIDNKKDAMEEYMEEINSSRNQTTTERYLDATEEYNEEMKDK